MKLQSLLAFTFCLITVSATARAQILLTVNIYDKSAVTITATGTAPSTTVGTSAGYQFYDGFDLDSFFTSDAFGYNQLDVPGATLTTGDSSASAGAVFKSATTDDESDPGHYSDLSLYGDSESVPETFTTGTAAFSGSITLDLSGYTFNGRGGRVVAGYEESDSSVTQIGTYQFVSIPPDVPEPSVYAMIALGFASLLSWRRFRTKLDPYRDN